MSGETYGAAPTDKTAISDGLLSRLRGMHYLFAGVLLLLATSRWGSYLHLPGLPVYVADFVIIAALVQAGISWRRGSLTLERLRDVRVTGWLLAAFLVWAVARVVTRTALPMVAVRDFAPYAYAIAAPLAVLFPVRGGERVRRWIYAALTIHALWYIAAIEGVVDPATTWRLAAGAAIFSTRPDFDAAIFGTALGLAIHQIAFGPRPRGAVPIGAMSAFIAANAFCLGRQHSRSGLLAAAVAVTAVVAAWLLRGTSSRTLDQRAVFRRSAVATVAVVGAVLSLLLTVPGQRLIGGLDATSQAGGTARARELVLEGVSEWLLESPVLTVFGVGYGPHMLARSGTVQYLEGTEFTNVRAPHNYLVGTWARLGLIGALLAAALFVAAGGLALRRLSRAADPVDILAALLVLTIPVVALFGVILESPFGALPYFWAVGQLCATTRQRGRDTAVTRPAATAAASAGA